MQDPQQYFNTIAQMIVQSAAASAAQDEARMQREQDLAYRREQMGLERERLADQRRLTDTQVEGQKLVNKRNARIEETEEREATLSDIDDVIEQMETGEIPAQRKRRLVREKQDLELGAARDEATVRSLQTENEPTAIRLRNSAAEEQIKASKAAQELDAFRQKSEMALESVNKAIKEAQLRGVTIANDNAYRELSKARRDELFARNGWLTPETRAALGAQYESDLQKAHIEAANRAATKKDDLGNVSFDMDAYRKELDRIDYIAEASGKYRLLQKSDPDGAAKIQAALKIMGEQLIRTTSDPSAVGQALVTSLNAMVDSVGGIKPKTDKVEKKDKVEKPPGEISLAAKPDRDEKESKRKLKVESNRRVIAKYLSENIDELRQLREIVAKRVGGKDLATEERIIDFVKSRFSPEGGMDPGGFGLSEAIPNIIEFEKQRK